MIWLIRHISVRLWLTAIFSMPISIYIVLQSGSLLTGTNPVLLFLFIALFFFIISGFTLDFIGKKMISNLIKEGAAWERAEIYKRSEEKYYKALRIYDSFMISPFSAKSYAEKLSKAIAKFTAVSNISDANFNKTATLFLKLSPEDEHMALLWLKQLFRTKDLNLNSIDHDTLTLIAENHYDSPKILPLLTNIFLQLKRTDFTAQKIFKKALIHLKKESKKRILIQELIKDQGEEQDIPTELSFAEEPPRKRLTAGFIKKAGNFFLTLFMFIPLMLKKLFHLIIKYEKTKIIIKFSFVFLAFFLAIFLIFNALTTLFKPAIKKSQPQKQTIVKAPVPKMPYTIQIAAFLSQPHAETYTKKLKKTGLDARFIKVEGKSKTWYLVRISKFPDKSSAAEYGQKLKREGLIKDFFVANK